MNSLFCPQDGAELTPVPEPRPSSWGDYWKCSVCDGRYQRAYPDRMGGNHHDYTLTRYDQGTTFQFEKP